MTVKEFIADLQNYDQDLEMYFGGLDFYRLKEVGDSCSVEFNQSIIKGEDGKLIVESHL